MEKIIRYTKPSKKFLILIFLIIICICLAVYFYPIPLIQKNRYPAVRGVITTLIRSTDRSIILTINMIHSIIEFYPAHDGYLYPIIIFHDENFTAAMRQQILSCVHTNDDQLDVRFALINFTSSVELSTESPLQKTIGYRLMCRFWSYDIFYHPTITQGNFDYLMRMDDDSYFSNFMKNDPFVYIASRKLDYIYRSYYNEPYPAMEPILKRFIKKTTLRWKCIYNNFFVIRMRWLYESTRVQRFLHELIDDDLILREYIGDGCVHAAMLEVDSQTKVERVRDIPYGHNFHLMPEGYRGISFRVTSGFHQEILKSCEQLSVLQHNDGTLKRIKIS